MKNANFGSAPANPMRDVDRVMMGLTPVGDEFGGQSYEYLNLFHGNDQRDDIRKIMIEKASIDTQTGGIGTAGTALVPVYVDSTPVDRTHRMTPMTDMMPRRATRGMTYDYIPLTAKGGASWEYENAAIADQVDTYDRTSVGIKFLYAKGRISGPSIAAMRGFIEPTQLDLSVKTRSLKEAEEDCIINGDNSTYPYQPNGLIQSVTTNSTSLSGASLTIADFRAELATTFNANGLVTLAVTDASTHNAFKALLQDYQRNVAPATGGLPFGIPDTFSFDGVDVIKDRYMPTTAGSRRMLLLDMRYMFWAVLQDATYEEKADENDSQVYLIKEYLTFVITFEAACAQITSIA